MLGPGSPIVAAVVAAMEKVVGIEHHAAGAQRPDLEGAHQGPAGVFDSRTHADVVAGAAFADFRGIVIRLRPADRYAFHAGEVVGEIQMVCAGEIVVVLLVVERPVLREGHGGGGAHVGADFLGVVEHFHLHGLMVALPAAIERAVVVLVPVLIVGAAGEGRVVGVGHDGPVFAEQLIASGHQPGRFDHLQDFRDVGGVDGGAVVDEGALFPLVDGVVDVRRNAQGLRCQDDDAATDEIHQQAICRGVCELVLGSACRGFRNVHPLACAPSFLDSKGASVGVAGWGEIDLVAVLGKCLDPQLRRAQGRLAGAR